MARRSRRLLWGTALVTAALVAAGYAALGSMPRPLVVAAPHPIRGYQDAVAQVSAEVGRDGPGISSACGTRLFTHGRKVGRVAVLLHGFTSCPRQFDRFGRVLYEQGWNVLIPRLPRHGLPSRMTGALAGFTAEELVGAAGRALDLADALGDTVVVAGLSQGAVAAAYLAQTRPDLHRAVIIAPSFAPSGVPEDLCLRLTNALLLAPNTYVWWDPRLRERVPGPRETYPRYATHALGEIYRLGLVVLDEASRRPPRAGSVVVVTNAGDIAVNNQVAAALESRWRARGARVREYEFPGSLHLGHDLVDPEQPYQRVDEVYPVLAALMGE